MADWSDNEDDARPGLGDDDDQDMNYSNDFEDIEEDIPSDGEEVREVVRVCVCVLF